MEAVKKVKGQSGFVISLIAVILGMLVGAVIMLISGFNPIDAYSALWNGIFGSPYRFGETLRQVTPLIFTGLSVAFAFRTGLFNIGAEGQFVIGSLCALLVGIVSPLPAFLTVVLALIAGALGGAIWGFLPGLLKARFKVHEVITTIMLNYIGLYLTMYIVRTFYRDGDFSKPVQDGVTLKAAWLTQIFPGSRIHLGIFVAIIAAYLVYLLLWKTTLGFELRSVGFSPSASEYAGMSVPRNIIASMMLSGALAGLGGAVELLGVYGYIALESSSPGYGFDGIAVALIGSNTPIGVLLGGFLFGALTFGSTLIERAADVPTEIVRIIIALIIFFVAANGIVRGVLGAFTRRKKEGL
ncbi:ABC transporter permease [Aneurinibacillus tyrosinisolvens]|uniref:ABC transporter permease n=1 Tax=Aneurinibacillus tyrosinisolvens TaxID=1443435 RepID=UPI00063ED752|nr:ABC transporter permease [Aneurinibacillus tyrosinisolvens]